MKQNRTIHLSRTNQFKRKVLLLTVIILASVCLSSCGSGGGGAGGGIPAGPAPPPEIGISGYAVKGPVASGIVHAYVFRASGGRGSHLGAATCDTDGYFELALGNYTGPVWIEVTGGSYMDESTGTLRTIPLTRPLLGIVPNHEPGAPLTDISITALTSIAASLAEQWAYEGIDESTAAEQANAMIADYFHVPSIINYPPPDLTRGLTDTYSNSMINHALILAGICELAADFDVDTTSMIYAIMADVQDGEFDGRDFQSHQITINNTDLGGIETTTSLAAGINSFVNGENNGAGIDAADALSIVDYCNTGIHAPILPASRRPPITTADPPGGEFTEYFYVYFTSVDNDDPSPSVYYTRDGTTPTRTHYDGIGDAVGLTQDIVTILKFFAIDANGNEEDVRTEIYTINIAPDNPTADYPEYLETGVELPARIGWHAPFPGTPPFEYDIQVATDYAFNSILDSESGRLSREFIPDGTEYDTEYYWRVRASNVAGQSEWSDTYYFATGHPAPIPASPSDGAVGTSTDVSLEWASGGGKEPLLYDVQVSLDNSFNNVIAGIQDTPETFLNLTGIYGEYLFYWRVKSKHTLWISEWSETYSFSTGPSPPRPTTPNDGAVDVPTNINFIWDAPVSASDPVTYEIQISLSDTFSVLDDSAAGLTGSYYLDANLETGTLYYWRVKAFNPLGESVWSATQSFTTEEEAP